MEDPSQKRVVLVLEEPGAAPARWVSELTPHFEVQRVVSVIGSQRALGGSTLVAAVLSVSQPEARAASLIRLLRAQPGLESVPVLVLAQAPEGVTQAITGIPSAEAIDAGRAHLLLRPRITNLASAPRRDLKRPDIVKATAASPEDKHKRLQERFANHSAERSQRALSLCNELRAPNLSPERRRAILDDVKDLLNVMKGEATLLRLRGIAEVLASAESLLARIDDTRRGMNVPRGVVGLLSELASLNRVEGALDTFDVELHRSRLNARDELTRA